MSGNTHRFSKEEEDVYDKEESRKKVCLLVSGTSCIACNIIYCDTDN